MNREQIIAEMDRIKGLPVSALKLINLLSGPGMNIEDVMQLVEYDPGITANILKLANSSMYSSGREICSLRDAMVRIGDKNILKILLAFLVSPMMKTPISGYDLPAGELWKASIHTAIGTEIMIETMHRKINGAAFTAALLHDIGKILMGSVLKINAVEIINYSRVNSIPFDEAEKAVTGIDHAEAGAMLLEKWRLPEEIVVPVRFHHTPQMAEKFQPTAELLHISDALTMMGGLGAGKEGLNYKINNPIAEKLGLQPDLTEAIMYKTKCRYDELSDIFSI